MWGQLGKGGGVSSGTVDAEFGVLHDKTCNQVGQGIYLNWRTPKEVDMMLDSCVHKGTSSQAPKTMKKNPQTQLETPSWNEGHADLPNQHLPGHVRHHQWALSMDTHLQNILHGLHLLMQLHNLQLHVFMHSLCLQISLLTKQFKHWREEILAVL